MSSMPRVFLSYASEDRAAAERLARDIAHQGIDIFYADWEIRPGDSIRMKIDQGLQNCTHFIVLLTPTSITKPWVNTEIDAAFVLRVEESCRFIPLRLGLSASSMSPLLRGLNSPTLNDYEPDLRSLLGHICNLTLKPVLGALAPVFQAPAPGMGVSAAAGRVVEIFVRESTHGNCDPELSPDQLQAKTGLTHDELEIAVDELERRGVLDVQRVMGRGHLGSAIRPTAQLFARFDAHFTPWSPEVDAQAIVATLVNTGRQTCRVEVLATELGWSSRRINPAVTYLLQDNLITRSNEVTPIYVTVQFWLQPRARGWLRAR